MDRRNFIQRSVVGLASILGVAAVATSFEEAKAIRRPTPVPTVPPPVTPEPECPAGQYWHNTLAECRCVYKNIKPCNGVCCNAKCCDGLICCPAGGVCTNDIETGEPICYMFS